MTTSTDERPDHEWTFVEAVAFVSAGGQTSSFDGLSPILYPPPLEPCETCTLMTWSGGCSVIATADDKVIAQASFTPWRRGFQDVFSMSDNGDGTIVWGYYHARSDEEWEATGPGSADVDFRVLENVTDDQRYGVLFRSGFDTEYIDRDFPHDEYDLMFVSMTFEGEATENFSTEKAAASSVVLCLYASRS